MDATEGLTCPLLTSTRVVLCSPSQRPDRVDEEGRRPKNHPEGPRRVDQEVTCEHIHGPGRRVRRHTHLHTQSARGAHVDERDGVVEVPRTLLPPPLVPRDGFCLTTVVSHRGSHARGVGAGIELSVTCTDPTSLTETSVTNFHVSGLRLAERGRLLKLGETISSTRRCTHQGLGHTMMCNQPVPALCACMLDASFLSCHVRPSSSQAPDSA
jgi:hypothetical protein